MVEVERPADRAVDRIDTGPRFSEADALRLNRLFHGDDTLDMLAGVLRDRLAGDVAVVSSFGAESAVLLHLIASVDRSVPVLFLETGLQGVLGDRSPAKTVADLHGVAPTSVRQQHRRIRLRVQHLAATDPRFAPLGTLAIVA